MKYQTKKKIKNFFQTNWKWLIGTAVFLAVGVSALLIGFSMTGWSIIDWLKSPYAVTFFVLLGVGVLFLVVIFYYYYRSKIGEDRR